MHTLDPENFGENGKYILIVHKKYPEVMEGNGRHIRNQHIKPIQKIDISSNQHDEANDLLKSKCSVKHFHFINQNIEGIY